VTVDERQDIDDERVASRIVASDCTEAEVVRRAEADELRGALRELPSEQRQVIELAYFSGFTHTEISEMLEIPIGTVKGRMRLGLTKMRLALGGGAEVAV
jgi:RNA polymerase sigma-70 factor (ECF subfamily)